MDKTAIEWTDYTWNPWRGWPDKRGNIPPALQIFEFPEVG